MYNDSDNTLGLPLVTPSVQTIIPVVCGGNGNLQGFFSIAKTTFAGTETTFPLSEGNVAITTVTLPDRVRDSNIGVQQYMAAVYPDNQVLNTPWAGYSSFVNTNNTGYYNRHYMPHTGWMTRFNRGALIENLSVNMAEVSVSSASPTTPTLSNGTYRWVASVSINSAQLDPSFFDFNWVELFQASSGGIDPLSLSIVSNPAGGVFKATLVPNPSVMPLGGVQFNTLRIIKLSDAAAGDYVFTFSVRDTYNGVNTCTLTLTVV